MYHILTGKQRSLVFPVMCNARIKMDYSENIPDIENTSSDSSDDTGFGIWGHTGNFTFEAVITPYEINGYNAPSSSFTANSKKIMPANGYQSTPTNYESHLYLSDTARLTHEMMIFYNTNFQISLVNATTYSVNNPAKYKIRVRLKLGSTTDTYDSPIVITPTNSKNLNYTDLNLAGNTGFDASGRLKYRAVTTATLSNNTLTVASNSDLIVGQEMFHRIGQAYFSLGTITNISGTTITITNTNSVTLGSSTTVFLEGYSEPTYINNSFHLACAFEELGNTLKIYFNGRLVLNKTHSDSGQFSFDRTDIYLGSNGSDSNGAGSATTNKQFMGEMHEISIASNNRIKFPYRENLMPNYDNTLLYLKFEEVDL